MLIINKIVKDYKMKFTQENIAEINLLLQFDINSTATGIKVHNDASEELQATVKRLYTKNLCTLPDGGYLTEGGIQVAEHADKVLRVLSAQANDS